MKFRNLLTSHPDVISILIFIITDTGWMLSHFLACMAWISADRLPYPMTAITVILRSCCINMQWHAKGR